MVEARRYEHAGEAELIEWAQAGDERAFVALVAPHQQTLFRITYRIVGDSYDAEDAVQATLLAAWRHLGHFEHRSKFSTWLIRIAHNAALGLARKRVPEPIAPDGAREQAGPFQVDTDVVERDAVREALGRIPPNFRTALVLREYAGMSYQEISEATGVGIETVKTRIARARQALARLLELS